ncbi:MAG: molybdopterin-dependent oxidoreductase [Alphaproteobacteria bacterium]
MATTTTNLPPNQVLASPHKWPVVGENAPESSTQPWQLTIGGLVENPRTWLLSDLRAMPQCEFITDIHCVTRWSKPAMVFSGVALSTLLAQVRPSPQARFISFCARSARGHATSLPLTDTLTLATFIAFTQGGTDLAVEHGGPMRTVVPGRYFYKSLKWLERIELLAQDRLGWWEDHAGYHNNADPAQEQRYVTRNHDRRAVMAMIEHRDLSGQDLLGLEAPGINLAGLDATHALLRNADFRRADLSQANFTGANLSNAHFDGADLRRTSFRDADLEGCSFLGADIRGADLRGASLFGATFCPEPTGTSCPEPTGTFCPEPMGTNAPKSAIRDHTTQPQPRQLEVLTQHQADFLTGTP